MSRHDPGNVVFRVQFHPEQRESQLVAYDLSGKAWYQTSFSSWEIHRELLQKFGVGETTLSLTDEAFATGTRDAQYPAIPIPLQTLDEAGFTPKIW